MRRSGRLVLLGGAALFYAALSGVATAGYINENTCTVLKHATKTCEVDCDGSDSATGGGFEIPQSSRLQVLQSEPLFNGDDVFGWEGVVSSNDAPADFQVYVVCDTES